jgi:hypothetical protein
MLHALKKYNDRVQDSANIIPEDEPVFLLRAQDKVAAETLMFWIQEQERAGGDENMVRLAREHYKKFMEWPKKKLADM